jgi:glycosyltransferase involved in cell wall biosynthesis
LKLADRLALISETQEAEINLPRSVPRSYIRNFLPSAILSSEFLNPDPKQPSTMQLIHSGRLSEGKGTFLFVEVCKRLQELGVPFVARITGGADESTVARLKDKIEQFSLQKSVLVLGRVPDADLVSLLHSSDVLVHLSRIDSYPLIVLEGLACSVLPVCMELAGARHMIETYEGEIVSESSPVEEAAAFLAMQNLFKLRSDARSAAHRVRTDYHWAFCAQAAEQALSATALNNT